METEYLSNHVLRRLASEYFQAFAKRDLAALANLFADNVYLKDWEMEASGKEAVLQANKRIFESVTTISVKPVLLPTDQNNIAAQLEILINGKELLHVLDLLQINNEEKITRIFAYKGYPLPD